MAKPSAVAETPAATPASAAEAVGKPQTIEDVINVLVKKAKEKGKGSVIVSSEKLSADEGWQPVELNTVVLVEGRDRVRMRKWGE